MHAAAVSRAKLTGHSVSACTGRLAPDMFAAVRQDPAPFWAR